MRFNRFRAAAALLLGGALVVSACTAGQSVSPTSSSASAATSGGGAAGPGGGATESGSSGTPPGPSDASLSIGFTAEPVSFDFTKTGGAAIPQVVLTNVYQTLVKLDQSGKIVPSLAEKWTVSPDNKTYTFTLHSGVKFSNGTAFTAADAKFSIDRVTTAWTPTAYIAQMNEKASKAVPNVVIASTTAVSPTVFEVVLTKPSNSWLFNMTGRAGAMFSGTGIADLANKPIGTGPYVIQARNKGVSITLQRNDSYWGTKPSVKTVIFKYFTDPTAMNNALLTGGIQVVSAEVNPQALGQFKSGDKYQIIQGSTDGEVMMTLNDGKEPFSDVRVRQAINYALDKDAILKNAWAGYGTVIGSHESPNDPWFVDEAKKYPHDVAKAKALLAAAGKANLTVTLTIPATLSYATAAAPLIVSELAEAGITVKTSQVTFPDVWLDKVFTKADYDMTIINHAEPRDISALWANPTYYTRYDNTAVQKLLAAGDAGTPAQYVADYKKAVELLADDAAAAWLWSFPNLIVANSSVKGLPKNAVGEAFVLADLSVG